MHRKANLITVCILIGLAVLAIDQGKGQTSTGSVLGNLTDQSGAAVAGAELILESTATGEKRTVSSGETGHYEFPLVLPGAYRLTVRHPGFTTTMLNDVVVRVNQPFTANPVMQVGQVNEQITVAAAAVQVNSTNATLGAVVDYREAVTLPIRGRSFLEFATLGAGAVSKYPGSWSAEFSGGRESHAGIAISGAKDVSTVYLIDGAPTKSPEYGQIGYLLPLESVQEFNIQRGFFSAKYPGPGVINIASVSGTNTFHGVAWHTIRNNAVDARGFFDPGPKPPLRQNQFGARAGGRLIKDKLFWMANFQLARERRSSTLRGSAPTPLERNGDFSRSTTIISDPFTKIPFAGNVIPPDRIVPFAKKYLEFIPPTTNASLPFGQINRIVEGKLIQDDDYYDGKVDYVRGAKDRFFVRFGYANSAKTYPSIEEHYARGAPYSNRNGVIGYTRVISPTLLNEFNFGYDRVNNRPNQAVGPGIGERDFNKELGLSNVNQLPACRQPPWMNLLFASYTSVNCVFSLSNNYSYSENLSWIKGRHSLNFGAQFNRLQVTDPIFNAVAGSFTFNGRFSGNPFSDFLLGHPFVATGLTKLTIPYRRSWTSAAYVEDTFRATKDLTLSFGLRWEFPKPPYDKYDNIQAFRPANESFAPNTSFEIPLAGKNGVSREIVQTNYKDFSPRFGFAWRPFGRDKWSVRGSYGLFYETLVFNEYVFMSLGVPFTVSVSQQSDPNTPTVPIAGQFGLPSLSLGGFQLSVDPDRKDPYLQQWTFSIERELPGNTLLSTAYVGSHGVHLFKRMNYNVARPGPEPLASRLPFPIFGGFIQDKAIGGSTYHSLQVDMNKRFSQGLSYRLGYTWSRSMDFGTSQGESMVPWNVRLDKGRTEFDVRHRLVFSSTYELPFGAGKHFMNSAKGAADKLVSGWQLVAIATFQSGFPLTPRSIDLSNTQAGLFGARPNRIGSGILPTGQRSNRRWFDSSGFVVAPVGTIPNSGTRFLDGPGLNNWDLSLLKNTRITERVNLQTRFEFFNAFNKTGFGNPNMNISTPTVGQIFSSRNAREIQFVWRVTW